MKVKHRSYSREYHHTAYHKHIKGVYLNHKCALVICLWEDIKYGVQCYVAYNFPSFISSGQLFL